MKLEISKEWLARKALEEEQLTTLTNIEDEDLDDDQIMTIGEYLDGVKCGALTDYDGHGNPATETHIGAHVIISPSNYGKDIPQGATHIVWYNK
jgi:hypothetical protein